MKRTGLFLLALIGALGCSVVAMAQPMGGGAMSGGRPGGPFPPDGEFPEFSRGEFRQEFRGEARKGAGEATPERSERVTNERRGGPGGPQIQGEGSQRGGRPEAGQRAEATRPEAGKTEAGRPGPGGPEARPQAGPQQRGGERGGERGMNERRGGGPGPQRGRGQGGRQGGGERIIIIERIIERVVPAESLEADGPRRVERTVIERRGPEAGSTENARPQRPEGRISVERRGPEAGSAENVPPQRGARVGEGNLPEVGMRGPGMGMGGAGMAGGMGRGPQGGQAFGGRQFGGGAGERGEGPGPRGGPRPDGDAE